MKKKLLCLLASAVLSLPALLPHAVLAQEFVTEDSPSGADEYISDTLPEETAETDAEQRTVPEDAAIIDPGMTGEEISEALAGSNYAVLTKGTYSKYENYTFDAEKLYIEDGVVMNSLTLYNTDLEGTTQGAKLTLKGSLGIEGDTVTVSGVKIVSSEASSAMTSDYLKQGRLIWTSRILNLQNADLQLTNNNVGPGIWCGDEEATSAARSINLTNTTLNSSKNKGDGLTTTDALTGTTSNINLNLRSKSKLYLDNNAGNGFTGGSMGVQISLINASMSASGNTGTGLCNALVLGSKTDTGSYSITASKNGGYGLAASKSDETLGKALLSVNGYTVTMNGNGMGGLLLNRPKQTALELSSTTLKASDNQGPGLQIEEGTVKCANSVVTLTNNANQKEPEEEQLKTWFGPSTNSLVYTNAASEALVNTLDMVTVTFNGNGGTFSGGTPELTATKQPTTINGSVTITVPESIPQREGYVFKQWNTEPDGTGTKVIGSLSTAQSMTVYAIWREPNAIKPEKDPNKPLTLNPETGGQWVYTDDGEYMYKTSADTYAKDTFLTIDGVTYYFNDQGLMVLGLQTIGAKTYFFNTKTGAMETGWVQEQDEWYYMNAQGEMQTGWVQVHDTWYYLNADGTMKTGWLTENGATYFLDHSGAMKTRWLQLNGKWYFFDPSGRLAKDRWVQDAGKWYFVDQNGVMLSSTWLRSNGKQYWLDNSGAMKTGWLLLNGTWYWLDDSGAMVTNTTIDGYDFDESGACTNPDNPRT